MQTWPVLNVRNVASALRSPLRVRLQMKHHAVYAGIGLLLLGLLMTPGSSFAQVKIGTVDLETVRKEVPEFKKATNEIDEMVGEFESRRDRQREELDGLAEDLRDAQQRGLQGSIERLQNELQSKSADFQKFMEETFGTDGIIETKSSELLTPLYDKLAQATEAVAQKLGLDLVLDLEVVNPLFVSDRLDVTDAVLDEFDRMR
jgi:outer membrane protein